MQRSRLADAAERSVELQAVLIVFAWKSLATTLLEEGIDAAVVSAVLGHSSPAFTASVYQHVTEGLTEQAAAAIDRRFAR